MYDVCLLDLQRCFRIVSALGIPIKHEKTVLPTALITFVRIEINSELMETCLPLDKLQKNRNMLDDFQKRRKVISKDLQSLIRLLNFA